MDIPTNTQRFRCGGDDRAQGHAIITFRMTPHQLKIPMGLPKSRLAATAMLRNPGCDTVRVGGCVRMCVCVCVCGEEELEGERMGEGAAFVTDVLEGGAGVDEAEEEQDEELHRGPHGQLEPGHGPSGGGGRPVRAPVLQALVVQSQWYLV